MKGWSVSPYPDGHSFGFTIVHDADDAYSARLAPIFKVFDEFGIKITATAFAFWADWAEHGEIWKRWRLEYPFLAPKALPLEDPCELDFYRSLVENGHEVGLHSASDTDDKRSETIRAFEFFRKHFGYYPQVYVEHRDNLQNHQRQGANPESEYYLTDILNRYGPWVWVVSPSALPYGGHGQYFDVLSTQKSIWFGSLGSRLWGTFKEYVKTGQLAWRNGELYEMMRRGGSPFDGYARSRYGLLKAFRRSGTQKNAHGDGFAMWYSDRHIDLLEENGGLAIVYTHLNTRWIDRTNRTVWPSIQDQLVKIASRDAWLATASEILNRFQALERVYAVIDQGFLKIVNGNKCTISGLTINAPPGARLAHGGKKLAPVRDNRIVIGDIPPLETAVFRMSL